MKNIIILIILVFVSFEGFSEERAVDSILNKLHHANDPEERATYLNDMGVIMFRQSDYDTAIYYFIESAKILEQLGDTNRLYKRYFNIGSLLSTIGQHRKGITYLNQSLEITLIKKDSFMLSQIFSNLGSIYNFMDVDDSALFFYEKALTLEKIRNDSTGLAAGFMNIGNVLDKQGDYELALEHYEKALSFAEPLYKRYKDMAKQIAIDGVLESIYGNLGHVHISLNHTKTGIEYLQKVVNFDSEFASLKRKRNACKVISNAYETIGDHDKSLDYYKLFIAYSDTLFDQSKAETINEITIKYESDKRDIENQALKEKSVIIGQNLDLKNEKLRLRYLVIAISVIFVLAMVFLIIFLIRRNKTVKLLNANLENKNQALQLAKQKYELKALLNQINPHFIFNVLNSIQQFIVTNDSKSSFEYFSKFGSLIRSSLEHSEKQFVPLFEELDVIQNYVQLENLRFEEKIDLRVRLNEADPYNVKIPPMFIQPLIENAIVHGFGNKEGEKILMIEFKSEPDSIICFVTDNGVGRRPSKIKKSKNRNSGLTITRNRLKSVWDKNNLDVEIETFDLKDKNTNPSGTKVKIVLPKSF